MVTGRDEGQVANNAGAAYATEDPQRAVLVTTERSVRGIDLPHLDCVAMLYTPLTSDTYVHLAGRTGRAQSSGTALTLVPAASAGRLGLFTGQLGVSIKPMTPPPWLASRLAQLEAQRLADRNPERSEAAQEMREAKAEADALVAAFAAAAHDGRRS